MKYTTVLLRSLIIVVAFLPLSSFAIEYCRANYEFIASNSYKSDTGDCIPSFMHVVQIENLLMVSTSSSGPSEAFLLNDAKIATFKALAARDWGKFVTVVVDTPNVEYTFLGESCGRMLCDSVEIKDKITGSQTRLEQSIHGELDLRCK